MNCSLDRVTPDSPASPPPVNWPAKPPSPGESEDGAGLPAARGALGSPGAGLPAARGALGSPGAALKGCTRGVLWLGLGLVACLAAILIAALLGSFGYAQIGPGGVLSDIRTGRPAPDFELPTLDGEMVRLSDFRGRPVLLSFWATFCPQCARQLPLVAAAEAEYDDVNLAVVAVSSGQSPDHVRRYLERRGLSLRVLIDPDKAVYRAYRVVGLPTTLWLDADGVVRAVELGELKAEIIGRHVAEATAESSDE